MAGRKSCTSRFRLLGEVGDWFRMGKKKYVIIRIDICDLGLVANYLYKEEGCNSPDEFWRVWKEIHPRRTNPKLTVWVHHFIPFEQKLAELNEHIKYARERQDSSFMKGDLAAWRDEKKKLLGRKK